MTITKDDGTILTDDVVRAADNGFVGVWLPRNSTATLTVVHDGRTGTSAIGTGTGDPTCLTTLQVK